MNKDKLAKLEAQVRIGGKGTSRRKKKYIRKTNVADDKKLQNSLKSLSFNPIPDIEEVKILNEDGSSIHFKSPKVEASLTHHAFAVSGKHEYKRNPLEDQVGKSGAMVSGGSGDLPEEDDDDDVPDLVENFDEASKAEVV